MNKRAVFVLGPHRSGTSLVAAAIESLGFSLGNRSDWVNEDNPKGFFENSDVTPFNDRLLKFLDSRWDNPLFYGRRALAEQAPEDLEPWYQEAVEIVDRNFSSTDAWLVKDPRICVLLPFWHEVLRRAGYAQADVFHCYVSRNPVEAARSQQKRHHADPEFHFLGEELQESVALWYAYSLQALDEATDANNICVDYNEFLQDPRGQLGRLAEFLRADSRGPMTEGFLTKFVDTSLHRSHSTEDELRAVTERAPFVAALYGSYQQLSGRPAFARDEAAALLGSEVSPRLWFEYSQALAHLYPRAYFLWQDEKELHRQLAGHFDNLKSVHENLQADYERLVEEIRLLEEAKYVVELNAERLRVNLDIAENDLLEDRNVNDELQKQLDALYSTTSWRWTWPLRFGSALARRDRKTVAEELTRAHGKITAFRSTVASRHPGLYRRVLNPLLNLAYNAFRVPLKKVYLAELEELAARGGVDPRAVGGADSAEFRGFQPSERFTKGMVDFEPKVTVIVPNYNHANYLRKRLDSIYGQTYGKFRVLLLDDCSSDDSREILSEYAERYPEITTTLFNKENSGNVFRQWARGIGAAESDIIWIAESDDYCDPDFLEKLVPFFRDEAVMLAYAHSVFVDEGDEPSAFTFEQYLSDLSVDKWQQTHVETAHNEVAKSLGQKNIIPNVSSAVFRKGGFDHLFEDEKWLGMKICGDWIFYLHLIRGGKIAYSADTNNYYRFHAANSSVKTYVNRSYYEEHEAVACEVAKLYDVPDKTLQGHRYFVERFFLENASEMIAKGTRFDSLYDASRIEACRASRLPNLMIASYAFSTGGGEVFPIRLAIGLKRLGYGVTFFNFNGAEVNEAMRQTLAPDIPVVELSGRFQGVDNTLKDFGIEIVHTHHASVDHFFALGRLRSRNTIRQVVTMHGMYEAMDPSTFRTNVVRMAPKVDHWIYIADKNLAPFEEAGIYDDKRYSKIGNGMVRPQIERASRDELGIAEHAFVACLASRALPEKGWREAIRMTSEARRNTGRDIQLVLLGDGPVYEALQAEQAPEYVRLLGFRQDAVNYYAMADAGILPTRFKGESFPLTIIECFMAGRPVIATDVGEVRNMMTSDDGDVAGFVVGLEENGHIPVSEFAGHLASLASEPELYKEKQRTAEVLAPRFEMSRVLGDYARVYTTVIGVGAEQRHAGSAEPESGDAETVIRKSA